MAGPEKDKKGRPTRLKLALKAWGFGSKASASKFCQTHKKSQKGSPMPLSHAVIKSALARKANKKRNQGGLTAKNTAMPNINLSDKKKSYA